MALIRGVGSLFPCPRCLIPDSKLGTLSATAPLRTADGTKAVIYEARKQQAKQDKEEILKNTGLRDVDVCFHFCHFTLLLTVSL